MRIDNSLTVEKLLPDLERLWKFSGDKIRLLQANSCIESAPVYTVKGRYTSRGWTEWTQGFAFGSELLQFDASGDVSFLEAGKRNTIEKMAAHVTHFGVHDHGFNNISTYGNLLRLMKEKRIEENEWECGFYELALKCSGAVQANRWTELNETYGYIYSFNGPHSLFADTIRSLRSLAVAFRLGHKLMGENDRTISLLERLIKHARTTARWTVFYGEGRDTYDVRGRTAHESIFNVNDGNYRCPNSQQGFSPFTTWTRGLAWIITGFAEQVEFINTLAEEELAAFGGKRDIRDFMLRAAQAAADFYLEHTFDDGIPLWDTGAPKAHCIGDYEGRTSDPFNSFEPVDSSAAAIAAQGLMRLGYAMKESGKHYFQAGLSVMKTLMSEPYLSVNPNHEGLLLHANYHVPNGWDAIPEGQKVPCGEACMWGDYHLREAAFYIQRLAEGGPYLKFYL